MKFFFWEKWGRLWPIIAWVEHALFKRRLFWTHCRGRYGGDAIYIFCTLIYHFYSPPLLTPPCRWHHFSHTHILHQKIRACCWHYPPCRWHICPVNEKGRTFFNISNKKRTPKKKRIWDVKKKCPQKQSSLTLKLLLYTILPDHTQCVMGMGAASIICQPSTIPHPDMLFRSNPFQHNITISYVFLLSFLPLILFLSWLQGYDTMIEPLHFDPPWRRGGHGGTKIVPLT